MNRELIEKIIAYNYNEYGAEYGDALVDLKHENEWLHHIIKEVREYMKSIEHEPDADMYIELGQYKEYKHILQILDKVGDIK